MRVAPRRSGLLALFVCILALAAPLTAPGAAADAPTAGEVVIDEIANADAGGPSGSFFELRNAGSTAVSLDGWRVYRCDAQGLRTRWDAPEVALDGVELAPGGRVLVRHRDRPATGGAPSFAVPFSAVGFGLVLIDPRGDVSDRVAVYANKPEPTLSECGEAPNLPVTTAAALDESWQRTDGGWVRAPATPGIANASEPTPSSPMDLRIEEIAPAGAGGSADDLVEVRNAGDEPVPLAGWSLYRCTARGVLTSETLQHRLEQGVLEPGERLVVSSAGAPDVRTATSLADLVSGVLLVDPQGRRGDGVTISSRGDTACQTGDKRLAADLDFRTGESWQRSPDGAWVIAPRTPGRANASVERSVASDVFAYGRMPGVAISEFAADPEAPDLERAQYIELGNYGDEPVDLSGWRVVACGRDGFRAVDDLAVVAKGTVLDPGATWTAALAGTDAAADAQAEFRTPFELAGAGVWVEDAAGRRVDSVGAYHRNEMDDSVARESPCTKGLSLPTFGVDRLAGETWQRAGFSESDVDDFVAAPRTPGRIDAHDGTATDSVAGEAVARAVAAAPQIRAVAGARSADVTGTAATIVSAVAGASDGPLVERSAPGERPVAPDAALDARDDAYAHPYLRLAIDVPGGGAEVRWSGRTVGRAEVRLSVWDAARSAWREVDAVEGARTAASGAAEEAIVLSGRVRAEEVVAGVAEVLVQVVPRSERTEADGIADPDDYDLAISHLTDTQYYSEAYPEVYAEQVAWIAANAEARKIAFATHTGDLIQSWIDPDQREDRARHEFATASRMQRVLDDAGIPNSVLPGNHDNKRGITNDLFNEYFGPDRYADAAWSRGTIAPGDNSANWSLVEAGGARLLTLSLPYAYGEREIAWAEDVVAAHPDANVVLSTHEHVLPKNRVVAAARSTSSRWVSQAQALWDRVIAPNRNVVLVLSGHFHGIGTIVTEDAGGIPGHTVVESLADYQEFRTHTGERATGFQRLLQVDLSSGMLSVDTFSERLGATASHPYDYMQFLPDDGDPLTASNERPWRVVDAGLQGRYTDADDEFEVALELQHAKAVETDALVLVP